MNLFSKPPATDPRANRARADELHRDLTRTVRVPPPDDGDVTAGCWACGVGEVEVSGDRRFERTGTRRDRVCAICRGSGAHDGMTCVECRGGTREPGRTVEVEHEVTRTVQARDMSEDALALRLWARITPPRRKLDLRGADTVVLWTCPTCATVMRDSPHAFGQALVEWMLVQTDAEPPGWDSYLARGGTLGDEMRRLTFAGRVLARRARGRSEPPPNARPWAHLPSRIAQPDVPTAYGEHRVKT